MKKNRNRNKPRKQPGKEPEPKTRSEDEMTHSLKIQNPKNLSLTTDQIDLLMEINDFFPLHDFRITSATRNDHAFHQKGMAVDIASDRLVPMYDLFNKLIERGFEGGLGLGPRSAMHIHLDCRTKVGRKPSYWIETHTLKTGYIRGSEVSMQVKPNAFKVALEKAKAWYIPESMKEDATV